MAQESIGREEIVSWIRLAARLVSLATSTGFLLILFLEVTNEDGLLPSAIPANVIWALTILAGWVAWRLERVGGGLMLLGALGLSLAVYSTVARFGSGIDALVVSLIYGLPLLTAGVGFLICGQWSCHLAAMPKES